MVVSTVETVVTHGAHAAATIVKSIVVTVMTVAKEVVSAVIQTVEDAVGFIAAALKRIGAEIVSIVNFLKALFDWDDILTTHDVVEQYLGLSKVRINQAIQQTADRATNAIDLFKQEVDQKFPDWIKEANKIGAPPGTYSSGENRPPQGIQSNYVQSMAAHNVHHMSSNDVLPLGSGIEAGAGAFTATLGTNFDGFQSSAASNMQSTDLADLLKNPEHLIGLGLGELLKIVQSLIHGALTVADILVQAVAKALEAAIDAIYDMCTGEIKIPYVTDFYENIVMKGKGRKLTIFSLFALAGAVPATIAWKLATGKEEPIFTTSQYTQFMAATGADYTWIPVPGEAQQRTRTPLVGEEVVRILSAVLGFVNGIAQVLWGIAVTLGDLIWLASTAVGGVWNPKFERPLIFFLIGAQLVSLAANFPYGTDFAVRSDQLAFAMWLVPVVALASSLVSTVSEVWSYPGDPALNAAIGAVFLGLTIWLWIWRATETDASDGGIAEGFANLFASFTSLVQGLRLIDHPIVQVGAVALDAVVFLANTIIAIVRASVAAAEAANPPPPP